MSLAATVYVFDQAYDTPVQKLIMLALADFADDHARAWPAVDTIARRAQCSRRSVQEHIKTLEAQGHLQLQINAGPRGTHIYRIIFSKNPKQLTPKGAQPLRPHVHLNAQTGDAPTAKGGANQRRPFAPEPSGTIREPQEGEERASAQAPAPPISSHPFPTAAHGVAWQHLTACFPDAPPSPSPQELRHLRGLWPHLLDLTPDDWTAILAWNQATDRIRGRKHWPRDRGEFIAHFFEAIQKIRPWWRKTGKQWWACHTVKKPHPDPVPTQPVSEDHTPLDPLEALRLCREE